MVEQVGENKGIGLGFGLDGAIYIVKGEPHPPMCDERL